MGKSVSESSALSAQTHYARLGLHPSASVVDIRRAYRELSRYYHPDTTELSPDIAKADFQLLNEAYATLSNPERRLQYDHTIGYSSVSVVRSLPSLMQPSTKPASRTKFDPEFGAYLDAEDRPLSSGELFALFILGITFVGCGGLVVLLSVIKG